MVHAHRIINACPIYIVLRIQMVFHCAAVILPDGGMTLLHTAVIDYEILDLLGKS